MAPTILGEIFVAGEALVVAIFAELQYVDCADQVRPSTPWRLTVSLSGLRQCSARKVLPAR